MGRLREGGGSRFAFVALNRWMFFVSGRYFRTRRREKGHAASVLSVTGIAAGVTTLIVVLAVMNGFQLNTIDSILEIDSYDLRVTVPNTHAPDPSVLETLRTTPGVRVAFPFAEIRTLAQGYFPGVNPIVLRAVPPDALSLDRGLGARIHMVAGGFDLGPPGSIVIGVELAHTLGVRVGDSISILNYLGGGVGSGGFVVTGIFRSGYYDYDLRWGFISLRDAAHAYRTGMDVIYGVKLDNRNRASVSQARVERELRGSSAKVESWRTYNRAIFGALHVEKTAMMLLIGLIFLVVGANIYQSLRRAVFERTEDVGVLKALGARPREVQRVFVFDGFIIGFLGATIGTMLGLFLATNIDGVFSAVEAVVNFALAVGGPALQSLTGMQPGDFSIFSPVYFYLSGIPSHVYLAEVFWIYVVAFLSAMIAAALASRRVVAVKPAVVLRYE